MLKIVLINAALVIAPFFFAQNNKLYFVKENDSTTTVRDAFSNIIIPAYLDGAYRDEVKEEIKEDVVIVHERFLKTKIYDRKGNFLFEPALFDYDVLFKEGHIPFKENDKFGLANKEGEKLISAKYDYLAHPEDGVVFACNNCTFDRKADPEHPPLTGGTWIWLDKKGRILDSKLYDQLALFPSPLPKLTRLYNDEETAIIQRFEGFKSRIKNKLKLQNQTIKFEVVYRPTYYLPYYHVKLYVDRGDTFMSNFDDTEFENFYVSQDLKHFLVQYDEWQERKVNDEDKVTIVTKYIAVDDWLNSK